MRSLEGLGEFSRSNLCSYNTFKIENILTVAGAISREKISHELITTEKHQW